MDETGMIEEVYGWSAEEQDYVLLYRGTDKGEIRKAQRAAARLARERRVDHGAEAGGQVPTHDS